MRNGFRRGGRGVRCGFGLAVCEMLERREMLSAVGATLAVPFPVTSVGYLVDGDSHFESTDSVTGIQTHIWFDFQQIGGALGAPPSYTDYLLSVSFSGPDGSYLGGSMNVSEEPPPGISVSISPDLRTMHVVGDFDPVGDGTQLWLDVQWTLSAITSHSVGQGLDLSASGRTWTDRTDDHATASAVATAKWDTPPTGLDPRIGATALDLSALVVDPGSNMEIVHSDTRSVPSFYDVGPLIDALSPPARTPAGANVSAERQQYAGAQLLDPTTGAYAGLYWLDATQDYFTNAANYPISGGFYLPSGLAGGTPDGSIDSDARFASDSGSGLAGNAGADDPTPNTPFTVNVQVAAIPASVDIAFSKAVTTTADTIAMEYGDTTQYQATASGSISIDLGGTYSPVFGGAEIEQMSSVTIIVPQSGGSIPVVPTTVLPDEWNTVILGAWSKEAMLAGSHGLVDPRGSWPGVGWIGNTHRPISRRWGLRGMIHGGSSGVGLPMAVGSPGENSDFVGERTSKGRKSSGLDLGFDRFGGDFAPVDKRS